MILEDVYQLISRLRNQDHRVRIRKIKRVKYKSSEIDTHIQSTHLQPKWSESRSVVSDSLQPHGLYSLWNSPGQNTAVGNFSLLQGIFPTQGLNPDLQHCRQILHQLSHKGSPILEWVAYPFSSSSSTPRNRTSVSWIAGGFFTNWAIREALAIKVTKAPT